MSNLREVYGLTGDRDNEKPAREVKVHAFQAQGRPLTNEEVRCGYGNCNTGQLTHIVRSVHV